MKSGVVMRLALVVLLAASTTGCALAAGIFRAGFWVGVILAIVLIIGVKMLMRGRR